MSENLTLAEIKAKIDIIQLANDYGFELTKHNNRYRAKSNLLREEKTSSLDFFEDTQKFYDRGTGSGGDVFDLVEKMENISQNEAIQKIKQMVGAEDFTVTKREYTPAPAKKESKEINFNQLKQFAINELNDNKSYRPFTYEIVKEQANGFVTDRTFKINITPMYQKLFEVNSLDIEYESKINKLFTSIIGYSKFWDSPSIILTDRNDKVIDIVAYRPKSKETGEEIKGMKYYYKNKNNRGVDFVYPFEKLVKYIANREKYIVVGEGLKNSVNALLYGVPFISLESTGDVKNIDKKLLDAINEFVNKGFGLVGGFDGDESGAKGFLTFISYYKEEHKNIIDTFLQNKKLKLEDYISFLKDNNSFGLENLFTFESNIDFTDYVTSDNK